MYANKNILDLELWYKIPTKIMCDLYMKEIHITNMSNNLLSSHLYV